MSGAGGLLSNMNRTVHEAVAKAGYHGRDAVNQRGSDLQEQINNGQLVAGGPETVLAQITHLRDEIGAGIVDLTFAPALGRDKIRRAIEIFGTKVLPRMREL